MDLSGRRKPQWGYPFFGLTDNYRLQLHELIFDLVHYGKFQYDAVYSMPVQYRNFYVKKLGNTKEKERQQMDKASGKTDGASSKMARGPAIGPKT